MTSPAPTPEPKSTAEPAQPAPIAKRRPFPMFAVAAAFPTAAAILLNGWRGALSILLVLAGAMAGVRIWQQIGRRGSTLRTAEVRRLALLLALLLPGHLAAIRAVEGIVPWNAAFVLPLAAGLLVAILAWVIGVHPRARAHPAVLAILLLAALFHSALAPRLVLHRKAVIAGDLLQFAPADAAVQRSGERGWISWRDTPAAPAVRIEQTAAERLSQYTRGTPPRRVWLSLDGLIRDYMPPLEDLAFGGHPAPLGAGSAFLVVVGGLVLVYGGVTDFRVPLLAPLAAMVALLLLPVPIVVSEDHIPWLPLILPRTQIDWPLVITFASYELLASPLLLTTFFLATAPCICPQQPRARTFYALLLGILAAAAQLYISCALGPYLALAVAAFVSPWMEERFSPVG